MPSIGYTHIRTTTRSKHRHQDIDVYILPALLQALSALSLELNPSLSLVSFASPDRALHLEKNEKKPIKYLTIHAMLKMRCATLKAINSKCHAMHSSSSRTVLRSSGRTMQVGVVQGLYSSCDTFGVPHSSTSCAGVNGYLVFRELPACA